MAAEESSQGAALGPEISETGDNPPASSSSIPDLHEVQGEFLVALSVIDTVSRSLTEISSDASEGVGLCALALKHGVEMLNAAYTRFDEGLLAYGGPSDGESDDLEVESGTSTGWIDEGAGESLDGNEGRAEAHRPGGGRPT